MYTIQKIEVIKFFNGKKLTVIKNIAMNEVLIGQRGGGIEIRCTKNRGGVGGCLLIKFQFGPGPCGNTIRTNTVIDTLAETARKHMRAPESKLTISLKIIYE